MYQLPSLQEQRKKAESLEKDLKTFFSLEGNGFSTVKVGMLHRNQLSIPTLHFKSPITIQKLVWRIKEFGFPVPDFENDVALFKNLEKIRPLSSGRQPQENFCISEIEIKKIFGTAIEWAHENNHSRRVCCGPNFIRVQSTEFAKTMCTVLKTKFGRDFKFVRVHEDIFVCSKEKRQTPTKPVEQGSYKDHITQIITETIGVSIYETEEDTENNEVIIAFESEEALKDAKDLCEICNIKHDLRGTTLVFPSDGPRLSIKEVQERFDIPSPSIMEKTEEPVEQEESFPTPDSFNKAVRDYVKQSGYEKLNGTAMLQTKPFQYRMGLKGDLDLLLKKVAVDKPNWGTRRRKDSPWILFFLHENFSSKKEHKDTVIGREKFEVSESTLPKAIKENIELLRREIVGQKKADFSKIREATSLIFKISKKLGVKKKSITLWKGDKTLYPNARCIYYQRPKISLDQIALEFKKIGYDAFVTNKAIVFRSVFPTAKGVATGVDSEDATVTKQEEKPRHFFEEVNKKQKEKISIKFEISEEQTQEILGKVPDEQLLKEIKRRGTSFGQTLLASILSSWQSK